MSKKMLLMFLGGTPSSSEIIDHWTTLNSSFRQKENVFVVVHPKNFTDDVDSLRTLFKNEHYFKVDESHHIPTEWSTKSLVDAILLMIQYAHIQYKGFFDKYILLSSSCCPLYRLDVIYDDVMSDNKSSYLHFIYSDNICSDTWFTLDKRHVELLFGDVLNTYSKSSVEYICENIIGKESKLVKVKINTDKHENLLVLEKMMEELYTNDECSPHEEYLIIRFLYEILRLSMGEVNSEHFRTTTSDKFRENLSKFPEEILKRLIEVRKKYEKIVYLPDLYPSNNYYWKYNVRDDELRLRVISRALANPKETIYTQSSYSHMFRGVCYNPTNVLRNFSFFSLGDIDSFLMREFSPFELKTFIDESPIKKYDTKNKGEKKYLTSVASHPIEYCVFTLRSIVNTFILLFVIYDKLLSSLSEDYKFVYILHVYFVIILKEFNLCEKYKDIVEQSKHSISFFGTKSIIHDQNPRLKDFMSDLAEKYTSEKIEFNKDYGTFITPDILVEAICNGSFFLRKCLPSSLINEYSEYLATLNLISTYSNTGKKTTWELFKMYDVSFNDCPPSKFKPKTKPKSKLKSKTKLKSKSKLKSKTKSKSKLKTR